MREVLFSGVAWTGGRKETIKMVPWFQVAPLIPNLEVGENER